jgi:hypothetical protein
MRFLKRFCLHWANWLKTRQRKRSAEQADETAFVARELAASELVARFICSQSHISKLHARPKRAAFDPSPYDELSVVHSTGLADREVWEIGKLMLGTERGRDKIRARADVPVNALIRNRLRAILDDNPFKRHTSVVGWPNSDDPDQQKQERIEVCLQLSQDPEVKLVVPESPIIRTT